MTPQKQLASAIVILKDGKRVGWKINSEREINLLTIGSRNYSGFSPDSRRIERKTFSGSGAWQNAVTWVASFEAHPREKGDPPDRWEFGLQEDFAPTPF